MTAEETFELAGDFIRDLATAHGRVEEVNAVCRRWLRSLGAHDFGLVNAAAVRVIFADCLTTVAGSTVRPGDTTFTQPEEAHA